MATLNERVRSGVEDMQVIRQRHDLRMTKPLETRLALVEEHIVLIAEALSTLLEMKERGA